MVCELQGAGWQPPQPSAAWLDTPPSIFEVVTAFSPPGLYSAPPRSAVNAMMPAKAATASTIPQIERKPKPFASSRPRLLHAAHHRASVT